MNSLIAASLASGQTREPALGRQQCFFSNMPLTNAEKCRRYRIRHRDEIRVKKAIYQAQHKDERTEYSRQWRAKNRDRLNAYRRERYAKQRDRLSAYQNLWAKLNRDKKNTIQQRYRDRKVHRLVGHGRGI